MTQRETPWQKAREGLGPIEKGNAVIDIEDMRKFYSDLEENWNG